MCDIHIATPFIKILCQKYTYMCAYMQHDLEKLNLILVFANKSERLCIIYKTCKLMRTQACMHARTHLPHTPVYDHVLQSSYGNGANVCIIFLS